MATADLTPLQFKGFTLDPAARTLVDAKGRDVALRRSEFELLRAFVAAPGRALSRDHLLNAVASRHSEPFDRSVDVLVGRLRRKIEPEPGAPQLIVTVPGMGYRFAIKPGPVSAESEATPASPASLAAPERRQLTILRCGPCGPALSSARRDPEDLQHLLTVFREHSEPVITEAGGTVVRLPSGGLLAYFGYPQADEHQAERAVRAALRLAAATEQIDTGQRGRLQIRVGVATGLAVVGGQSGGSGQPAALGEADHLAAGLASRAEPDAVLIAASTRRLLGELFELRACAPIAPEGAGEPVEAWRVMGQAAVESRFEALHADVVAPLIGRDEELEVLLRRWRQAKSGEGQLALLSGEPGIGKSRLIAALEERLGGEPHESLRYFCSPHHRDSALYPIVTRWERDLRFALGETMQGRLRKLEAALAPLGTSAEDVALIADLLSVPVDERYPTLDLNPQRKKEKTFEALTRGLTKRTHRQPLLMLFEDAHWADASSLELLDKTIGLLANLPVLLVVSFRPEFQPPWAGLAASSLVTLRRLTQRQAAHLAERVTGERALSPTLLERVVTQADGIPLFIEELIKAVLEDVEQSESDAAPLRVPDTLQASLVARLDRLPAAKQVAQVGAVIGREFAHTLLAAAAKMPETQLAQGVDTLVASGLAFRRGAPPGAVYAFKHALVRDAAYGTLLRGQRQELHARIGEALEERFPEVADTQPELLAHHLTQAGLIDRAIDYWRLAGLRSLARSAHTEADAHFGVALDLLGKLPASERRDARELDLTLHSAVPLIAVHGFGALRVEECALRAKALSDRLPGSPGRFAARRLAWNSCLLRQPVPKTVALARDLARLAEEERDPAKRAVAHRALGYSLLMAGEFCAADETLARGAALADTIADREFAVYGEHPGMVCRAYGGQARVIAGFPAAGARLAEEAVAQARREENPHSLAWALGVAAHTFQLNHEAAAAARCASEAIDIARNHHLPQWIALGERCMGWAMHKLGDFDAGLNVQLQGVIPKPVPFGSSGLLVAVTI